MFEQWEINIENCENYTKYVLYNVEFVHIKKIYEKKYVVYEKEKSVEQYYMKKIFVWKVKSDFG